MTWYNWYLYGASVPGGGIKQCGNRRILRKYQGGSLSFLIIVYWNPVVASLKYLNPPASM